MTCNTQRISTAAIAILAIGCPALCCSAAEPAASDALEGAGNNETVISRSLPSHAANAPESGADDASSWGTQVITKSAAATPDHETWIAKSQLGGEPEVEEAAEKKNGAAEASTHGSSSHAKEKAVNKVFRSGPEYETQYDVDEQLNIYGGKTAVDPPRPLLEIGREQYTSGLYDPSNTSLGELNPLLPGLAVYGDWRTAVAFNKNNGKEIAQIATRLNIDIDFKFTATERIHAFLTPLQKGGVKFTRYEFGGADSNNKFNDELDAEPQTLFFEGDAGAMYAGYSGQETSFDLPFTVGLFPLFLQNGIWANDAILGGAFTLPAKNSAALGLSNFDITFFAGFDNVDNASLVGANGQIDNNSAGVYGVTAFIDAFSGYIEAAYAFIQGNDTQSAVSEHYLTAAYSRRYMNTVSNSTRVFANFGEDGRDDRDGLAIISENSLITSLPSTLLPYANFFVGFGDLKPLVDGNNAGILKNVGINFETDALTGYPKLDDTASNAWGGAIGLQYLFNLDQQLVFEVAMVQPFENDGIGASDPQYAFGIRYQLPLDRAWLFRADATYQLLEGAEDNMGIRAEVRRKF